jgi:hypothetical protein
MDEMSKTIFATNETAGQVRVFVSLEFLIVGAEVVRLYERDGVRGIGRTKHSSFVTHKVDKTKAQWEIVSVHMFHFQNY